MKPIKAKKLSMFVCDDDHLHVELYNGRGDMISDVAINMEDSAELVGDLMRDIGQRYGIVFLAVDAENLEYVDDIGETVGNA